MVTFKKYKPDDFVRCEHCKAALHFHEVLRHWVCKPECKKPTILKPEMRLVVVGPYKEEESEVAGTE